MGYLFRDFGDDDFGFLGRFDVKQEDAKKEDEIKQENRRVFEKEFYSNRRMLDSLAGACASVMAISTTTGIPLDDVFDMFIEDMREELHSDDTVALMELGKLLNGLMKLSDGDEGEDM